MASKLPIAIFIKKIDDWEVVAGLAFMASHKLSCLCKESLQRF
jgi:hypothetical protein